MFIPQETPSDILNLTFDSLKKNKNLKLIFYSNRSKNWTVIKICISFIPKTGWEQEIGNYDVVNIYELSNFTINLIDSEKVENLIRFGVRKNKFNYTQPEFMWDFWKAEKIKKRLLRDLASAVASLIAAGVVLSLCHILTPGTTAEKASQIKSHDPEPIKLEQQKQTQERVQENTDVLIKRAKQYALTAAKLGQNPPHTAENWQQIQSLWRQASNCLSLVSVESPNFLEVQKLLAQYQKNRSIVSARLQTESESMFALKEAQTETDRLLSSVFSSSASMERHRIINQMASIIGHLTKVKPGTTAYPKAQELLVSAEKKLKQLRSKDNEFR